MLTLLIFLTSTRFAQLWSPNGILRQGPFLCRSVLPPTTYVNLYDALVCGANLPPGLEKQMFIDTGLIHLMVVSGSHLVFIEMLLAWMPNRPRLALLGAYCYIVGFQAPVVRAFLRRTIAPVLSIGSGLTALQVEAAAVALALFIYPPWILSRSFLMSWMCGLALCAPRMIPRYPHLDQAVKSYFFLLPFCFASPMSIAWNTLLAPFVGLILFPACVASVVIPPFHIVVDQLWRAFLGILNLGPQAAQFPIFLSSEQLCLLPIVVHAFLLVMEVRWRRSLAFSYSSS